MPATSIPKLLIVDDESAQMTALCNTLENEGYCAVGFTSASAALTALREQAFDLLLSDLMMPEMDGVALLQAAREIDPNLVGIVMTGHGRIDTAVRAMQAGALDYILKPFKLTAILPVLVRALAVRRLRMENIQLHETVGVYKLRMNVALALDLDTVLQKIADAVLEQSRAQAISILLPSEDGHELRVAVTRGEKITWVVGTCIPFTTALTRWVEDHREFLTHSDKADVQVFSAAPLPDILGGVPIPMLAGGKLVGILYFSSEQALLPISGGQAKALNLLASTAASAIERASLLARVHRADQRYRRLAENAPDIVFRYELSPRPRVTYINPAVKAITGYSPEEYYADPKLSLKTVHPEDRGLMEKVLLGGFPSRSVVALRWVHRNGTVIWMEQRHILIEEQGGRLAVEGIARDITERKLADEKIRSTLREKEVMLNEIHHRVKNNLQVVSSLLSMQAAQVIDPVARRMFIDSQNRIQSMALIHQHLDMSSNFAEIDFGAYLRSLANHVLASYAGDAVSFGVALDASSASLSLSQAIPCGLIVNELVSNSLKHSFHGRPGGEVRVGFGASDGICTLTVDDDGSPLPHDLFTGRPPTMGVQLVQALTSQLGGELQIGDGPKFRITFSDQHATTS